MGKGDLLAADRAFEMKVEGEFLDQIFDAGELNREPFEEVLEPGGQVLIVFGYGLEGGVVLFGMGIVIFLQGKKFLDLVTLEVEGEECHGSPSPAVAVGEGMNAD